MSNPSITADKTPWYQWDTGLTVTVSGGEMNECHFANRKQGTAYVQAVINGVARVPDELLQVAAPIKAYGYVSDGAGGQTYVEQTFEVIARNIPADYTYTKTAQKTIRDAEAARDQAVKAAKDAKASELAADDSAVEASNSAQSAGESASAAATSASNAAKSAADAAKSASDAKAAASKTVEDASKLLKTYTDNAKTSADNAATSASNAADAASAASGSASAAEQSATDASNAKVAAQTAKAEAATSASNAATSASNAESSATAAAKSASDAAASVGAINVIAPKTVADAPTSDHDLNVTIGDGASTIKYGSIAIGYHANAKRESVSIGDAAVSDDNAIAIGYHANAKRESVSIGDAAVSDDNAIAIGHLSGASYNGSVAIGAASKCYAQNEFSVGSIEFTREITHVSTPTAPTSAATKKYTDDNDVKTLSEAKKYTDANTSNALVGNVSGKLLHVEDAWPGKLLGLTIDGAYKQDGTPSPDNPVPITVVENPVLKVTGRNLLTSTDYDSAYNLPAGSDLKIYGSSQFDFDSVNGIFSLKEEILPWTNGKLFATEPLTAGTYNVSFNLWSDTGSGAYTVYVMSPDYIVDSVYKSQQSNVNDKFLVGRKCSVKNEKVTVNDNQCIGFVAIVNGTTDVTNEFYVETPLVSVVTQDTYAPYVGTSIPITLPAEHPYLAALPDGTHDEIVIDNDGNASLVAMVGKTETAATDGVNATVGTDALSSTGALDDGATVYYKLATPVTYQLGKLDIPSLPETISNVWTDEELTTNMSMKYKRDINVAFDNLVQAVVASAAGE